MTQQAVNWALDTVELPLASWVRGDERISGTTASQDFLPSCHLCGQVFPPLLYLGIWERKAPTLLSVLFPGRMLFHQ